MLRRSLPALLAVLAACSSDQPRGRSTDSARVREAAVGIIAADNGRRLDDVLDYYAPDAILLPPNAPPVVGVAAIRPRYEGLFRDYDPAIDGTVDEIVVDGDLAYVRGRNGGVLRGRGGIPDRALNDVYVMVLRRSPRGQWLITRLIWHSADSPTTP